MLTLRDKQQLDELGYLVLPDFVPPPLLDELRNRVEKLWEEEGDEAGSEFRYEPGTRRLANLIDKGPSFAEIVSMPRILECIEQVIGRGYKLSSLNARSTNPHNGEAQPWHADSGAIADDRDRVVTAPRLQPHTAFATLLHTAGHFLDELGEIERTSDQRCAAVLQFGELAHLVGQRIQRGGAWRYSVKPCRLLHGLSTAKRHHRTGHRL